MEEKTTLFETVYQSLVDDMERGILAYGDALPSVRSLCDHYHVGIRTAREVLQALKTDGYITTEPRKRSTVAYRSSQGDAREVAAHAVLAREETVLATYRTQELIMPDLFAFCAKLCSKKELDNLLEAARAADKEVAARTRRLSSSSAVLHRLLTVAGNPLFIDCYTRLERSSNVPIVEGYENPYIKASHQSVKEFSWVIASLKSEDEAEIRRRIALMYQVPRTYVKAYCENLAQEFPQTQTHPSEFTWDAKAGRLFAHSAIAKDIAWRIEAGEYVNGTTLPAIARLAEEYDASLATIRKAIGILEALGMVHTINGKGVVVTLSEVHFSRSSLQDAALKRNIGVFLWATQMFCMVLPHAIQDALPAITAQDRLAIERALAECDDVALAKRMIEVVSNRISLQPLRVIVQQLGDLVYWGHFFMHYRKGKPAADALYKNACSAAQRLSKGDDEGFYQVYSDYYRIMLRAVRDFLSRHGMEEATRLVIP